MSSRLFRLSDRPVIDFLLCIFELRFVPYTYEYIIEYIKYDHLPDGVLFNSYQKCTRSNSSNISKFLLNIVFYVQR